MKKFAQTSTETGEIIAIIAVQSYMSYPSGDFNGSTFVEIPMETNDIEFKKLNFWKDDKWNTRIECPGENWYWTEYTWRKNLQPFWDSVKVQRTRMLLLSDWTQLPDIQLSDTEKESWRTYRQALRDIPTTYVNAETMEDITWPSEPT